MKKLIALLVLLPALAAAPLFAQEETVRLDPAPIDPRDVTSLQAGARAFVNYCLNCHSASLMRYSKLEELDLTEQQIKDNLLFTADKVGELMNIGMTKKDAKEWFGAPPPDLSVIARSRSADWLYTYLRSFYRDPQTATGWNNVVFPNVGMPHVLWQLQGQRIMKQEVVKDAAGKEAKDEYGHPLTTTKFDTVVPGRLSAVDYDLLVRDLVNYLVWMSEPNAHFRKQVGIVVLFFLGILLVLTYALYKEFWKDVH
jgi:ubiquinol-cytochrome c reductase cytochrome c1 subunit